MWKILNFKDIEWEEPPRGYYLTKVKTKDPLGGQKDGCNLGSCQVPRGDRRQDTLTSGSQIRRQSDYRGKLRCSPDGVITPVQPNMAMIMPKGGKHGATRFTEESMVLFFWDGSPKPVMED